MTDYDDDGYVDYYDDDDEDFGEEWACTHCDGDPLVECDDPFQCCTPHIGDLVPVPSMQRHRPPQAPVGVLMASFPETPKRIQRRRTKGWRMPEGAVYVGRPSKWGNPFRVGTRTGLARVPAVNHQGREWEYEGRCSADERVLLEIANRGGSR